MPTLPDEFMEGLVRYLGSLPAVKAGKDRDLSWRSASEILRWWAQWGTPSLDAESLDSALIEVLEQHQGSYPIRCAKYPGRSSMAMLWGHVCRVGEGPPCSSRLAKQPPVEFEWVSLAGEAPQVFVSHSFLDLHLAGRIRLTLSARGIRAWLAEETLKEGDLLIEGVRHIIDSSVAVLGVVTRHSLSSAWFDSELYYSQGLGRPVVLACDSTDGRLMTLLSRWSTERYTSLPSDDRLALTKIQEELPRTFGGTRISKYVDNAEQFLLGLRSWDFRLTAYPRWPQQLKRGEEFEDFETVVGDLSSLVAIERRRGREHSMIKAHGLTTAANEPEDESA